MLAVHALWDPEGGGELLIWAEDGEILPSSSRAGAAPGPKRSQKGSAKGSDRAAARPEPHPFAASAERIAEALAGTGSGVSASLAHEAVRSLVTLWLPGRSKLPACSPQLVRSAGEAVDASGDGEAEGLAAFVVPCLRLGPGRGLDLVMVLAGVDTPVLRAGPSIAALAAVGGLALEVVAGGRVLPELVAAPGGSYRARWAAAGRHGDQARLARLAAALPPLCRALEAEGADPTALVRSALAAFVDACCRQALGQTRRRLGTGGRRTSRRPPAIGAWLDALSAESPEVAGEPGELAKLERQLAEWRSGAALGDAPFRLCFRLCEPSLEADVSGAPEGSGSEGSGSEGSGSEGSGAAGYEAPAAAEEPWRIELLLQATDDLSLLVEAKAVWRSARRLSRAARSIEAPQEVMLGELGRAVRIYPELAAALAEPTPTGIATDLAGAHRFLSETAISLQAAGFGVLLPSWWRRPSSRLGLKLKASSRSASRSSGLLGSDGLLDFDWQAALGEERLSLPDLKRLAKLKQPLVRVRGRWVELRPGEAEKLAEFVSSGRRSAERAMSVVELLRIASGAEELAIGVPVTGVELGGPLGALLRGELDEQLAVRATPDGFAGELRPYQQRGVAWIDFLERSGLGACLADDMGLGKTATVLAVLQAERSEQSEQTDAARPTLVVCPTSVVGNWQREAQRFTPELSVRVHHGAGRAKAGALAASLSGTDLVITSYALAARDRAALSQVGWRRIVLDEAQNVKNPEAGQTKAVRALRAERRVALTGTPVENHLGELWSLMEILNPGLLGSATGFRERFAVPIERYQDEDAADKLRTLTRPFVLRRLKTDKSIITDLPEKLEMKVICNLTREQATLYRAVVDEMLAEIEESDGIQRKGLVLAAMLRLKQVCNHPAQYLGDGSALAGRSGKLERTVEILEEVLDSGERALVFSQFAEMGAMLRDHLQQRLGCRVGFLHGGVPRRARDELVAEMQRSDGETPILVLSLKAGGTGLNLTAANHVVHFDRWWNPAVENQATDRAFRIGQRRDVQVRKLVCAGTLEDRIDQLIESKRQLAERVIGTGESWLTELSTEELADVFRLSAESVGAA